LWRFESRTCSKDQLEDDNMPNEITKTQPSMTPQAHHEDVVVLARSPQEMEVAQRGLLEWADKRIARLALAVGEAKENLAIATTRKWKREPWIVQVKKAEARVVFYTKVRAALAAGYCIMPDLPIQILAVRTNRKRPPKQTAHAEYSHPENDLSHVQPHGLPAGEGRYVDNAVLFERWSTTKKNEYGNDRITNHARATDFDEEFDFPMRLVKPQVLDDTGRALALKIFDEIGILPATNTGARASAMATSDPVVVGRIIRKTGPYNQRQVLTFLISWWIDTSQI
jgi:hypothetical protein